MHASAEAPITPSPARMLDLVLLYPGAIEGGADQIIIDLLPEVLRRHEVKGWAFERTLVPVPVVALLLDVEAGAVPDIVDDCEEILSSRLHDQPQLAMQPLVDMPGRSARSSDIPWGVRHSRIDASARMGDLASYLVREQAMSAVVMSILSNVRARQWDRKTIAPTLLAELLARSRGEQHVAAHAYAVMQRLLADEPAGETLTRQFRINAHKLATASVPILLDGAIREQFLAEVGESIDTVSRAPEVQTATDPLPGLADVWKRMAGGLGFSAVEAAYIACLVSTTGRDDR